MWQLATYVFLITLCDCLPNKYAPCAPALHTHAHTHTHTHTHTHKHTEPKKLNFQTFPSTLTSIISLDMQGKHLFRLTHKTSGKFTHKQFWEHNMHTYSHRDWSCMLHRIPVTKWSTGNQSNQGVWLWGTQNDLHYNSSRPSIASAMTWTDWRQWHTTRARK